MARVEYFRVLKSISAKKDFVRAEARGKEESWGSPVRKATLKEKVQIVIFKKRGKGYRGTREKEKTV